MVQFQSQINRKLSEVDSKLKILDQLEKKVETVENEISKMWSEIRVNHKEYDSKINHIGERVHGIEFSNSEAQEKLDNLTKENDKLKDSLVYLQSQSMRNNLIFCNIEEKEQPENTEQVVRNFLVEKMKVAEDLVRDMRIERAHRMGSVGQRNHQGERQHRKIVCKFTLFKDRELIRKAKINLDKSQYYVHEQFPPEIVEKRRRLVPKMKEAITNGQRSWISYDTLYINGKPVKSG